MIYAAKDYSIKSSDIFFFDNNIWMLLFGYIADSKEKRQLAYTKLFKYIQERKRPIYTNSLVISEFANANIRFEYHVWKDKIENLSANDYKKDFLKSNTCKVVLTSIKQNIQKIISISTKGNDNFNAIDLNKVVDEINERDFNDAYYLQYCALGNYILVTDDGDLFRNNATKIDIITFKP